MDHDEYGVTAFGSTGVRFTHNTEIGNGGEAGIYVGDTPDADAVIKHNTSSGWANGILLRDSRNGVVKHNVFTQNCLGVTVLDTGPNGPVTDRGEPFINNRGGDWLISRNQVSNNTRFCPAGSGEDAPPALGGHGVVVVGADHVRILDNSISGNDPPAGGASAFPSSGVTILSGAVAGGGAPSSVLVHGNRLRNRLDVFWDGTGTGIVVAGNACRTATPASLCPAAPATATATITTGMWG